MAIDLAPELLDILACPNCHGSLAVDHDRDELVCLAADCGLAYPVRQGIPVLLIDEARRPGPDLPTRLGLVRGVGEPAESTPTSASRITRQVDRGRRLRVPTARGRPTARRPTPATGASAADGDERS